jgi:crossover junction endodeoxyribonuclease RuvC
VTGYAVIESDGRRSRHLDSGSLRLDTKVEASARLGEIFIHLSGLIERYQPQELAIEDIFVSKNASSALKLGQARGAAICAAAVQGLTVYEYAPRAVKQAIVGHGAADKIQVQHMVKRILNLNIELAADQADALAVALAHAHGMPFRNQLSKIGGLG